MRETDFLAELARCMPRLEEPCGIPSAPALLQLSRFAARDVKVVLAGQGADEPHGGYGRHQAAALLRPLRLVPPVAGRARRGARPRASRAPPRARRVAHLLGGRGDAERLLRLVEITDARGAHRAARARGARGRAASGSPRAREVLGDVEGRGLLEQALYLDTHMFLPDGILLCNDKMSMAAGLELRVPFLDLELMRFVERIPATRAGAPAPAEAAPQAWRWSGCCRREVVNRPKHGFATPYDDWLRASLGEEVERRYAPGSALAELIDPGAAARLVDEHRRGRADHKAILYCLLELSEWHARLRRGAGARGGVSRKRVLYVHSRKASFVAIDRDILAERYEVEDLYQPGRVPNPVKVIGGVLRADVVFGWFASWHTFFPITLAWLLRKPSVMIVGGFDTANMPDIGYGYQQGGLRRVGEPLDHAPRHPARHELRVQPQRDRAQHADPARARDA